MLFQIESMDQCFAIDLAKIDLIQIEDSGVLGAKDRFALCFYQLGLENAAEYNITRMSIEQQLHLFNAVCEYKRAPLPPHKYIIPASQV